MAFQQPTVPLAARAAKAPVPEQNETSNKVVTSHRPSQSQEWILFPQAHSIRQTETASTDQTPQTAGLSRLSDFGSLASDVRTGKEQELPGEGTLGSEEEEEEELDSLDDGLHAFRESGYIDQTKSILPRHNGLGAFPDSSSDVQRQIWNFERHNPRKRSTAGHQRRWSSVKRKLDAVEANDSILEDDKRDRIEKWRLEHSRILLDEIERETRRRQSIAQSQRAAESIRVDAPEQSLSAEDVIPQQTAFEKGNQEQPSNASRENESFIQRVTRRVIRDFIGIDEKTLSVIFGETLPEENPDNTPSRQTSSQPTTFVPARSSAPWETRLLSRLAKELGFLIEHLTEHPGAFSAISSHNLSPPDYAGIPVTQPTSSRSHPPRSAARQHSDPIRTPSFNFNPSVSPQNPVFTPSPATEAHQHASLWGIEEEPQTSIQSPDHEYWSQPANISSAFSVLRNHFRPPTLTNQASPNPNLATTSTSDTLRRTEVIRQYHPLVNRQWESRRRSILSRRYAGSSTCGSQSLRKSRGRRGAGAAMSTTTTTVASEGYSSRNFWDIGIGSHGARSEAGSLVGGAAGLGAWGEV